MLLILKFLRDPDTQLKDFKTLRLVCKTFDLIWAPVISFRLSLTPRTGDPVEQLHDLVKKPYLKFQALTLEEWDNMDYDRQLSFIPRSRTWPLTSLFFISLLFFFCLLAAKVRKAYLPLAFIHLPIVYLLLLLKTNWGLIRNIIKSIRTKRRAAKLSGKVQLPNVRSAR